MREFISSLNENKFDQEFRPITARHCPGMWIVVGTKTWRQQWSLFTTKSHDKSPAVYNYWLPRHVLLAAGVGSKTCHCATRQTSIIKLSNTVVNHDTKTPPAVGNYVLDRTNFLIATGRPAHDVSYIGAPWVTRTALALAPINSDVVQICYLTRFVSRLNWFDSVSLQCGCIYNGLVWVSLYSDLATSRFVPATVHCCSPPPECQQRDSSPRSVRWLLLHLILFNIVLSK